MKKSSDWAAICSASIDTPLGPATAVSREGALAALWFDDQKSLPAREDLGTYDPDNVVFENLRICLAEYFSGINRLLNIRLAPQGTDFQKSIWNILLKIPFGQVTTYGDIARAAAAERGLSYMSAQAVGSAVGHNPICILIPCHRVIGADRGLTGYAGGLDKKQALLRIERVDLATAPLYRPS